MCLISEIETPTHKPQFDRPKRARIALHGLEPWVPYPSTPHIKKNETLKRLVLLMPHYTMHTYNRGV